MGTFLPSPLAVSETVATVLFGVCACVSSCVCMHALSGFLKAITSIFIFKNNLV